MYRKIIRFIEIDLNYLRLPVSPLKKFSNVIATDISIVRNFLSNKKMFEPTILDGNKIYYDTPYATKTFLTGSYDFFTETEKGKIFDSKTPVIIDVGSNIGQYLFSIKEFFPNSKVICFEPDPMIFKLLKKNIKNYKNVKAYNLALSNHNKPIDFFISDEFSEWSSLHKINDRMRKIVVKSRRGDDILKNIESIDLLKIDVEGAELQVLMGLRKTLKRSKFILVECSLNRLKAKDITSKMFELLFKENFYVYRIGRVFSGGWAEKQGAVDVLFKAEE